VTSLPLGPFSKRSGLTRCHVMCLACVGDDDAAAYVGLVRSLSFSYTDVLGNIGSSESATVTGKPRS
jgi:hypothetical protein